MLYTERCTHCGACESVCPTGAATSGEGCIHCGRCIDVCIHEARKIVGRVMTSEEVIKAVLKDRVFYGDTGGVTCSGGEALTQPEFLKEILKGCKENAIHTVLDTSAFCELTLYQEIIQFVDLAYIDIKCIAPEQHKKLTGVSNAWILENIRYMDANDRAFNIRMPIIPKYNDADELIEETVSFLKRLKTPVKVWLLPFHAYGKQKYKQIGMRWPMGDMKNLERSALEPVAEKFQKAGLPVEIQ